MQKEGYRKMKEDTQTDSIERVTVRISKAVADRIQQRLGQTDFTSVDDYISYVLDNVLSELEGQTQGKANVFSKEDQDAVEERLRNLGYM